MPGPPVPATDRRVPPPPRAGPPAWPSTAPASVFGHRERAGDRRMRGYRHATRRELRRGPSASPVRRPRSVPSVRAANTTTRFRIPISSVLTSAPRGLFGYIGVAAPLLTARERACFQTGSNTRSGAGGFAPEPGPSRRGTAGRSDARPTRRRAAGYRTRCAGTSAECLRSFAKSYLYFATLYFNSRWRLTRSPGDAWFGNRR